MLATDAKTEKIEPNPKKVWRTKVSEAVCKRDWHNVRSFIFYHENTLDSECNDLNSWLKEMAYSLKSLKY